MEPLSIITSIAGIAAAGTALSKAIYEFFSSTRSSSKEMLDIARTIADLSIILGELRRVLRDGSELCNHKYLRRIKSAMRRISRIHDEVRQLMDEARGLAGFKWRLKRSEVQQKLARIESHKTGINLMLNILVLAITTRKQSGLSDTESFKEDQQGLRNQEQNQEQEIYLLRQQSENLAYAAHQSLVDLSERRRQQCDSDLEHLSDACPDQTNKTATQLQIQTSRKRSDDTANWLLDLIFSPYVQARMDFGVQSSGTDSETSDVDIDAPKQTSKNRKGKKHHRIGASSPPETRMAIYDPGAATSVVKELLADWTVLTVKEIESTTGDRPCSTQKEASPSEESQNMDEFISFTDALSRKFKFPFYKVEKFEGFKSLIDAAFVQVDVLRSRVQEGHFDLIGPDDIVMLPEVWDDLIRPGMNITMTMWPMDTLPRPHKPSTQSTRPKTPESSSSPKPPSTPVWPTARSLNETSPLEVFKSKRKSSRNSTVSLQHGPEEVE